MVDLTRIKSRFLWMRHRLVLAMSRFARWYTIVIVCLSTIVNNPNNDKLKKHWTFPEDCISENAHFFLLVTKKIRGFLIYFLIIIFFLYISWKTTHLKTKPSEHFGAILFGVKTGGTLWTNHVSLNLTWNMYALNQYPCIQWYALFNLVMHPTTDCLIFRHRKSSFRLVLCSLPI